MKKVLLVIDVQKGFITTPAVTDIKNNIDVLISSGFFDTVISTVYQNYDNSPIIRLMGWDKLRSDEEQELVGGARFKSDYIVKKNRYSGVNRELLDILKKEGGEEEIPCVFVVGVDTECCVLSTAIDLFELGIRPIVLTKYCGSSSGLAYHRAGILSLKNLVGACNIFEGTITGADVPERVYQDAVKFTERKNVLAEPTERAVVSLLKERGWHISFAESCTGGKAASRLVSVPDASHVLNVSYVTYANSAKVSLLGVSEHTIAAHGVVSEEVAAEMARGAAIAAGAEVGVATSGIAGPGGATETKPVGMVCFGFYVNGKTHTYTCQFGALGRNNVRDASVDFVYDTLLSLLA